MIKKDAGSLLTLRHAFFDGRSILFKSIEQSIELHHKSIEVMHWGGYGKIRNNTCREAFYGKGFAHVILC